MESDAPQVGGYRLLRRLGSGGMGAVHEAVDADGRRVALKLLHPHIGADPDARRRLAREVALLHRVRDAGVARVLDAEVEDAEAFVVTELIDGPTLEADVAEGGPFAGEELLVLAQGLAEALDAIHAVGVMHRDLKPGNVMLSDRGPVLIDFGIAQVADDARLTQTGMVTGTPGYLAPEVLEGAEPEPGGDWWAWAAVLTFAATGRPPFGRGPTAAVLARVIAGQADTTGLPPALARALRAALHPDPARRLDRDAVLAVLEGREEAAPTTVLGAGALEASASQGDDRGDRDAAAGPVPGPAGVAEPTRALPPRVAGRLGVPDQDAAGSVALPPAAEEQPTRAVPRLPTAEDPWAPPPADAPWGPPADDPWARAGAGGPLPGGGPAPAPPWVLPPRRQPLLVGAAGLALSAMAVRWPGALVVALVGLLLTLGTVGWAGRSRRAARLRHGPRRGDDARMYAGLPWHLLRAVLSALPGAVLGALTAVATLWAGERLLAETGVLPPVVDAAFVRWAAGLVLVVLAWLAPSSQAARLGARATIAVVAPRGPVRAVGVVLFLGVVVVTAGSLLLGQEPVPTWSPLPPRPWTRFG